ncbi:hypothetical protein FRB99_001562 [Tulasnella sp. 403]|nr:hypothetical protein FRB99_001562 [Tulasnella sp. 403]
MSLSSKYVWNRYHISTVNDFHISPDGALLVSARYSDIVESWMRKKGGWEPGLSLDSEGPQGPMGIDPIIGVWSLHPRVLILYGQQGLYNWNPSCVTGSFVSDIGGDILRAALSKDAAYLAVTRTGRLDVYRLLHSSALELTHVQTWTDLWPTPPPTTPIHVSFLGSGLFTVLVVDRFQGQLSIIYMSGPSGQMQNVLQTADVTLGHLVGRTLYAMRAVSSLDAGYIVMASQSQDDQHLLTLTSSEPPSGTKVFVPEDRVLSRTIFNEKLTQAIKSRRIQRPFKQVLAMTWPRLSLTRTSAQALLLKVGHMRYRQIRTAALLVFLCWFFYVPPEGKSSKLKARELMNAIATFGQRLYPSYPSPDVQPKGPKLFAMALWTALVSLVRSVFLLLWMVIGGIGGLISWFVLALVDMGVGVFRGIWISLKEVGSGMLGGWQWMEMRACEYVQGGPENCGYLTNPQPVPTPVSTLDTLATVATTPVSESTTRGLKLDFWA